MSEDTPFSMALLAGGCAGTSVDVALFPIDTVKTRLQAPEGFLKSGGFRGIYSGLSIGTKKRVAKFLWRVVLQGVKTRLQEGFLKSRGFRGIYSGLSIGVEKRVAEFLRHVLLHRVKKRLQAPEGFLKSGGFRGIYSGLSIAAIGSAPSAALFFSAYEGMKPVTRSAFGDNWFSHASAASVGEVIACLVRVPVEVVKQRMQAGQYKTLPEGIRAISNSPGGICTFYNGFFITVWREIPFSFIQFPLYERLKIICAERQGSETTPIQGACCGSISGGVAASVTTPLDVLKTRVMLHKDRISAVEVCKSILKNERVGALWSGVGPRTMWISIGGFVFFGAYEEAKSLLKKTSFWH